MREVDEKQEISLLWPNYLAKKEKGKSLKNKIAQIILSWRNHRYLLITITARTARRQN